MPIELKMPALSPTMEKGTLAKWLIGVGDVVRPGDLLAEIETDKATMEFESVDEGRLAVILVPEGTDDVPVGTVIATLSDAGDVPAIEAEPDQLAAAEAAAASIAGPPPEAVVVPTRQENKAATTPRASPADRVKVSPLAARIAHARGIDLSNIAGSGPNGRITRADLGLRPSTPPLDVAMRAPEPTERALPAAPAGVPFEAVKLSGMRKTIARRLTLAKQTVPHFYLSIDCRLDPLLEVRRELNAALERRGVKLSVNDFLIKALARALEKVPDANVQFAGDELYRFGRVDISIAVAIDGGLFTPVIVDAGAKQLSAIAREAQALAAQAREGRLSPEQYQGGTVSISNLGMFGIERIFPVINPPQAMILGVGAAQERVVPMAGQPTIATLITITASFDHRAIDGATAAQTMTALRNLIEEPLQLLA